MTFTVRYGDRSFPAAAGESVLDALLAGGVEAAHSCKSGSCGTCMLRAVGGGVPAEAQHGLKDSWKARGYFLPCVCRPAADIAIAPPEADARRGASIAVIEPLSASVARVRLTCGDLADFHAGQYVTILREGKPARNYSIASLSQGELEIHVRLIPGGQMSGWFHEAARPGDRVSIQGPSGDCFYVGGDAAQPLLLAGTGSGLAPLYGILLDALRAGHRGPIHLFHGAVRRAGLYLVEELRSLARSNPQLVYTPTVLEGGDAEGIRVGAIDQVVLGSLPKLKGWRAFLCGDPGIVQSLRKRIFLAGAASRDIHADAFVPAT